MNKHLLCGHKVCAPTPFTKTPTWLSKHKLEILWNDNRLTLKIHWREYNITRCAPKQKAFWKTTFFTSKFLLLEGKNVPSTRYLRRHPTVSSCLSCHFSCPPAFSRAADSCGFQAGHTKITNLDYLPNKWCISYEYCQFFHSLPSTYCVLLSPCCWSGRANYVSS